MLLGQFLGHMQWTSNWLMKLLTAVGYLVMDACFSVATIWNTNPFIIDSDLGVVNDDIALNRASGEDHSTMVTTNASSPSFQQSVFGMQDHQKQLRKRRWILGTVIVLMGCISVIDGLEMLLVSQVEELFVLYSCYFAHIASLSLAAYSAMIHARLHRIETKSWRWFWWIVVTAVTMVAVGTSSIIILVFEGNGNAVSGATYLLSHPAVISFYGVAAGVLLRIHIYFHSVKSEGLSKRDTLWGLVIGLIVLAETMATSVYL